MADELDIPDWVVFTRREVAEMARCVKAVDASSMAEDDPARAGVHLLKKVIAWAVERQNRRNEEEGDG